MQSLANLFGESPFEHIVTHARKIHECVNLIRPITEALLVGDMARLTELQALMSATEFEADKIKDGIRQNLSRRMLLPVSREDILTFVRQLDRMGDDAEDYAVVATFRKMELPSELRQDFTGLVDKIIQTSEALLSLAEELARLQKDAFEGSEAERVLLKIQDVCHLEWESDKLSRALARRYYSLPGIDPLTVMILDKLCRTLTGIADHAENVGKSLRLMIVRQ
jgi:predicted phosphate transport protein (TIGR00153 family)